jgi:hypothetical protein
MNVLDRKILRLTNCSYLNEKDVVFINRAY